MTRNLRGEQVDSLAEHYRIRDVFSAPTGGYALFLRPDGAADTARNLILLPGTHPTNPLDRDAVALASTRSAGPRPMGQRDDARVAIGSLACKNLKPWLDSKLAQTFGEGRGLTVAGHSLGGAVALRWFSLLGTGQQPGVDLIAYVPPGLEKSVVQALVPIAEQIRLLQHRFDIVPYAGLYQAPGYVCTIRDCISEGRWNLPHAKPQLALRELRGEKAAMSAYEKKGPVFNKLSFVTEPIRLLVFTALWPFLRD